MHTYKHTHRHTHTHSQTHTHIYIHEQLLFSHQVHERTQTEGHRVRKVKWRRRRQSLERVELGKISLASSA